MWLILVPKHPDHWHFQPQLIDRDAMTQVAETESFDQHCLYCM